MSLPVASEQTRLTHPKYRADVDGLRAIAVLAVVGYHAFPDWIKGGFVGVDIFFVISGFLISSIIISSLENGTFSFTEFYARRVKRIFPALIVVMGACFTFGWFVLIPDEYKQLSKHIAAGAGFVSNLIFWQEAGYFDNAALTKPLLHLWSLGVEEQFYLVWPLLLFLAWKWRLNFLILAAVIVAISFAVNVEKISSDPVQAFYSPLTRFWELMTGSILAYSTLRRISFGDRAMQLHHAIYGKTSRVLMSVGVSLRNVQSALGMLLFCIAVFFLNQDDAFPGWWALLPAAGTYLIMSAGQHAWFNQTILSHRILVWFGLISYPLYLWHWPLISFARIVEGDMPSRGMRVAGVMIAIALAWLTYRFVENPIRRSPAGTKIRWLVASMTLIFLVAVVTYLNDGFVNRYSSTILNNWNDKMFELSSKSDKSCIEKLNLGSLSEEVCITNSKTPNILFVGDSHSMAVFSAINAGKIDIPGILISAHSCPLYANLKYTPTYSRTTTNNCTAIANESLRYAKSNDSITTVIMSNTERLIEDGTISRITKSGFTNNGVALDAYSAFIEGNGYYIGELLNSGKSVVFMVDVPSFKYKPVDCERRHGAGCTISESELTNSRVTYLRAIQELQKRYPQLIVFDSTPIFCKNGLCNEKDDGGYLYQNNHHLNIYGSEKVINLLLTNKFIH